MTPEGVSTVRHDPSEGFRRGAAIFKLGLTSEFKFIFSGKAFAKAKGEDVFSFSSVEGRMGRHC
ncbi:MAG: hypothetical protein RMK18_08955 [Armatimonadota bacterium]|nr:hypothetical protein [Armatimonadota bacterium]MCX7777494.1 hypothetical protein [Armatimonadota bacterium]MDW8025970.1 hypothetical protein [Armatimonadota bacterium]